MKQSAMGFIAIVMVATSLFISCKKPKKVETPTPTVPTFTDSRDGKVYKTVTIGTQTWMAENLNYQGLPAGSDTCYQNNSSNCTTYGALYTWNAANLAAPAGWHLPSDAEWKTLEMYLGMTLTDADMTAAYRGTDQGTKVKEGGSSGLNLKLAGDYLSSFQNLSSSGGYWTSTSAPSSTAYFRLIDLTAGNTGKIYRSAINIDYRFSVRCIRD
jgi:uncharacterized protein (TIGR02145 family)